MSENWLNDIEKMHQHYGANEAVKDFDSAKLKALLLFRFGFLKEELTEGFEAIENNDAEEIVDALIDLVVVALGTLDIFGIDGQKAWEAVLTANMAKQVGIKATRPNPLKMPDLIKPEGWIPPSHIGNHGTLSKITD